MYLVLYIIYLDLNLMKSNENLIIYSLVCIKSDESKFDQYYTIDIYFICVCIYLYYNYIIHII